jgi:predicted  nucleic acid-binding Zn-ribbon protein
MNPSAHLFQIQKKDTRANWIDNRLKEIQTALEVDQVLLQAQADEKKSRESLFKAQSDLRSIESEVQTLRIKKQTSEAALYGGRIHNPKELQDIQNEIASLKKRISVLEDNQLNLMQVVEDAESSCLSSSQRLSQVTSINIENEASLRGEISSLSLEKERLSVERQVTIQQLSPELIEQYERLRKQKRGLAVVTIQDNSCSGCGTTLRPAEIQSARNGLDLVICSNCGRIIYAG